MAIRRRHTIPATFLLLSVLLLLTFIHPTLAACECGYLATIRPDLSDPSTHTTALFTDILETDFSRLLPPANQDGDPSSSIVGTDLAKYTPDWAPQAFNLTAKRARGEYGEMFDVGNVRVVDPAAQGRGMAGDGRTLELVVRKGLVDGMVPVAEVDTRRLDVGYGTFRAVMKVPGVKGTCAAFFWYHNDTQEIDIEFLSKDFSPSRSHFPVNLVLQSRRSAEAGHDASGTENFVQTTLPFDPTADFHEYRIDYLPGMVVFYADGAPLATMTSASGVPTTAGHLILSHWSNGNPLWSGGPPREDAVLKVRSVKAYFNSSDPGCDAGE
ncbi:hypothetical protein VTJ04DRAFT_3789 [Mycothermus thermophilus]|uniref:uncharacterized protein n=1 Tax=Humicola insolens TaxID=85995 RepID=UPI00374414F9